MPDRAGGAGSRGNGAARGTSRRAPNCSSGAIAGCSPGIHRYTLTRLRAEIEPVTTAEFMRFLFTWQRVEPETRAAGLEGLSGILDQLDGFELPAGAWEDDVLALRISEYDPVLLDTLCLTGRVSWAGCPALASRKVPEARAARSVRRPWHSSAAITRPHGAAWQRHLPRLSCRPMPRWSWRRWSGEAPVSSRRLSAPRVSCPRR